MISAFGVDHGYDEEFEKAAWGGLTRLGSSLAGAATKGGNALRRTGAANIRSSGSLALSPGTAANKFRAGGAQMKVGGALKRVGAGMAARPGLTGGLAAGGAVGTVGGTGFMAGRRRQ